MKIKYTIALYLRQRFVDHSSLLCFSLMCILEKCLLGAQFENERYYWKKGKKQWEGVCQCDWKQKFGLDSRYTSINILY